jgi:hypothetical protein
MSIGALQQTGRLSRVKAEINGVLPIPRAIIVAAKIDL